MDKKLSFWAITEKMCDGKEMIVSMVEADRISSLAIFSSEKAAEATLKSYFPEREFNIKPVELIISLD